MTFRKIIRITSVQLYRGVPPKYKAEGGSVPTTRTNSIF